MSSFVRESVGKDDLAFDEPRDAEGCDGDDLRYEDAVLHLIEVRDGENGGEHDDALRWTP